MDNKDWLEGAVNRILEMKDSFANHKSSFCDSYLKSLITEWPDIDIGYNGEHHYIWLRFDHESGSKEGRIIDGYSFQVSDYTALGYQK